MLVLASASPRRRELLTQAGYTFTVAPAHIPEDPLPGESPIAYVVRLAREKAEAVCAQHSTRERKREPILVLGADTTVVAPTERSSASPSTPPTPPACSVCSPEPPIRSSPASPSSHAGGIETAAEVTHVTMLTLPTRKSPPTSPPASPPTKPAPTPSRAAPPAGSPASTAAISMSVGLPLCAGQQHNRRRHPAP